MGPVLIAGLTFLSVTALIIALWWAYNSEQMLRARLTSPGESAAESPLSLLRTTVSDRSLLMEGLTATVPGIRQLERLTEQAGWQGKSQRALGLIILFAAIGGLVGGLRMGSLFWVIVWAVAAGSLPVLYLRYLRQKRLDKFSEQFPEALDMMTRALRTGYAAGPAFQMVAEEMPDPVAPEFRRVFEQISLGRPATEALKEMHDRIPTEDVRFFYVTVSIQREVGGNLAEILEKLAEVVRERYKLLAYAATLSAQQKASAYCVAASPFVAAIVLSFAQPTWFDPMWTWPYGKYVILVALALQAIGFFVLRRIANIKI